MAINIFQNGGGKSKAKVNQASNSTRAQQAKSALAAPSEASSSGNVAVKSGGVLSKVGNFIGKAAGVASKFLPGVGGAISKGLANLFNDPEWWQSIPGDAVTLNAPLVFDQPLGEGKKGDGTYALFQPRAAMAEVVSMTDDTISANSAVLDPTINMVTQYLMPEIRKVVNAIPLQSATAYQEVLRANAIVYALWRQLKKFDYFLKHGTTYIPNTNVAAFPILQVANAAWLQSTINRLEEYLRANVRLPHTLCEYLAWRFGRVYRSNSSAKAAIYMYNVLSLSQPIATYESLISKAFSVISSSPANQMANADIYNAYYEHDFMVEIADATQFAWDFKEFMLRTNLDINTVGGGVNPPLNPVVVDSSMDNPTTFMASTISTIGVDPSSGENCQLMHVDAMYVYVHSAIPLTFQAAETAPIPLLTQLNSTSWWKGTITSMIAEAAKYSDYFLAFGTLWLCKSIDAYNKNIFINLNGIDMNMFDLTALSIDMGTVDDKVIGVEQTYAFANLVDISRKTSLSYAKAEKLVARDTANLIDTLDVAAPVTK